MKKCAAHKVGTRRSKINLNFLKLRCSLLELPHVAKWKRPSAYVGTHLQCNYKVINNFEETYIMRNNFNNINYPQFHTGITH